MTPERASAGAAFVGLARRRLDAALVGDVEAVEARDAELAAALEAHGGPAALAGSEVAAELVGALRLADLALRARLDATRAQLDGTGRRRSAGRAYAAVSRHVA